MATAHDVARYILQNLGRPVAAVRLQKLVYYAQAWHLVWDEQPLFDDRIEAWANGPVVRALYATHRGKFSVRAEDFPSGDPEALTASERESVDAVLGYYGDYTAHQLSELTHREDPWREARSKAGLLQGERGEALITHVAMVEYYDGLTTDGDG